MKSSSFTSSAIKLHSSMHPRAVSTASETVLSIVSTSDTDEAASINVRAIKISDHLSESSKILTIEVNSEHASLTPSSRFICAAVRGLAELVWVSSKSAHVCRNLSTLSSSPFRESFNCAKRSVSVALVDGNANWNSPVPLEHCTY